MTKQLIICYYRVTTYNKIIIHQSLNQGIFNHIKVFLTLDCYFNVYILIKKLKKNIFLKIGPIALIFDSILLFIIYRVKNIFIK